MGVLCATYAFSIDTSKKVLKILPVYNFIKILDVTDNRICYIHTVYYLYIEQNVNIYIFQIKLYDHRLTQRGPIQSYDGNVNSHSRLELGVDPSEKFVLSG